MQKKLIALAVASLASGTALAQSNVTIYGVVDAGYVYSSGSASKAQGGGTNTFSGIALRNKPLATVSASRAKKPWATASRRCSHLSMVWT
jgi:predicted porin